MGLATDQVTGCFTALLCISHFFQAMSQVLLVRLHNNGSLDGTFGVGGVVIIDIRELW
jgi:hypothetical protein